MYTTHMSDSVQEIKDRLSITDVIAPYVELHKAGKNYKGKSPFTSEKTPSFFVSPDRGMYYCFSTSQGGDMFTFIQSMEGVDFKGALKILAEKAGVELVPEAPEKRSARDRAYLCLETAKEFYVRQLELNKEAKEYLKNRGVNDLTIGKWSIGYAPGPPQHGWRELKEALENKGFTKEELLSVGLIKTTDSGKEPFDVFRDRIVFPMNDTAGRTVAFSGRILSKDSEAPKYVNSPETDYYKKSELLFGYDKAKAGIRTLGFSLIVEGQFDVVMCHQAGYHNSVAVSGTALTIKHVQLLERLADRVVLALDSDKAGIAAMKRAADLMLRRGIDIKVAEMPDGSDPADLIADDARNFKKVIGKSVHVIEFLLHILTKQYEDTRTLKLKAREEILPFIHLLPNRIDQDHFVSVVAKAIGTTTEAVRYELERLRLQDTSDHSVTEDREEPSIISKASDQLMSTRIFIEGTLEIAPAEIQKTAQAKYDEFQKLASGWVELPKDEVAKTSFILEQQYTKVPDLVVAEELASKLSQLRTLLVRNQLATAKQQLAELDNKVDDQKFTDTLSVIKKCEEQLRIEPIQPEDLLS